MPKPTTARVIATTERHLYSTYEFLRSLPSSIPELLAQITTLEERLFGDQLDPTNSTRMLHNGYAWHYRPSHHITNVLIETSDLELLQQPEKRLLSMGAHPAYLERILIELGLPATHLTIADSDPRIVKCPGAMHKVQCSMLSPWPELGQFDRIIFPESLCIALTDAITTAGPITDAKLPHPTDTLEAKLLAQVLNEALEHLAPGGIIRANGPMSHPNVVKAASTILETQGRHHALNYTRYLMTLQSEVDTSRVNF